MKSRVSVFLGFTKLEIQKPTKLNEIKGFSDLSISTEQRISEAEMSAKQIFEENKLTILGGVLLLGAIAFNFPNIQKSQADAAAIKALRESKQKSGLVQRVVNEDAARQAKIANERYQGGCQIVVNGDKPDEATTISEGQPVLDGSRKSVLSNGTVVCDLYGGTAVIQQGVAAFYAYTGDRAVVEARKQESGGLRQPSLNQKEVNSDAKPILW